MNRICHCGAQVGYPHREHCPFPLFHEGTGAVHRWNFAFKLASACSLGLEDVFTFGEHQNEAIGNVIEDAPGYIAWAMDEIPNFSLDSEAYEAWEETQGLDDPLEGVFG